MQRDSRLVSCDYITVTLKERRGGGLCGGTWRGARWRQLCWGYEAGRVEEKTNERKKRWVIKKHEALAAGDV